MAPSIRGSSTPVTVTVCGVSQLLALKLRLAGVTLPSVLSLLEVATVTVPVGWLDSLTVKVAVPPASVVWALMAPSTRPALSLSALVTPTVPVLAL